MFDNLSEKLDKAFKILKGQGNISEINVAQTMKEIRRLFFLQMLIIRQQKNLPQKLKKRQ